MTGEGEHSMWRCNFHQTQRHSDAEQAQFNKDFGTAMLRVATMRLVAFGASQGTRRMVPHGAAAQRSFFNIREKIETYAEDKKDQRQRACRRPPRELRLRRRTDLRISPTRIDLAILTQARCSRSRWT